MPGTAQFVTALTRSARKAGSYYVRQLVYIRYCPDPLGIDTGCKGSPAGGAFRGNALRGVTFCPDRKLPKSCSGEMLSVVLPHAKPLSPENLSRHALAEDGAGFRL